MDLEDAISTIAPGLLRFCRGVTGDRDLAEEIAQEALTALVGWWRREGSPDSPQAFAFGVARRIARRALWRRRLFRPLDTLSANKSPAPDPQESAHQRTELQRTCEALGHLSTRDREAILLAAAGELTTAEAAELLGISRSAFKMRVHRARKQLHRTLETSHESGQEEKRVPLGVG